MAQYRRLLVCANTHLGYGPHDDDITYAVFCDLLSSLDGSNAVPPDLIPRVAYTCGSLEFLEACWQMLRLAGPGACAHRPTVWRWAVMMALYKKGCPLHFGSWRKIFIKSQLGLFQEKLLCARLRPDVFSDIYEGQSGFWLGVEAPQLLLFEITALAVSLGLPLWAIFGDFLKAFPKTWRELAVCIVAERRSVSHGALALLGSILQEDTLHVWHSGASVVKITQGMPEGGSVGNLLYTSVPDTLVRALLADGHGIGLGITIPSCWQNRSWSGLGTPDMQRAAELARHISAGLPLPSIADLDNDCTLEACALKALDLSAPRRLVAVLQCDDPVLLASSRGEANVVLAKLARWCWHSKSVFHVGADKTVGMVLSGQLLGSCDGSLHPLHLPDRGDTCAPGEGAALSFKAVHKWLGLLWPASLDFGCALAERLSVARAAFSDLPGLVAAKALPLAVALEMFEAKVEGTLAFGRWCFALAPDALTALDDVYNEWALALLGADPWRNVSVAASELGWQLSGSSRALLDIARRRAKVLSLPLGSLYRDIPALALHCQAARSWSARSAVVLTNAGVTLWESRPPTAPSYDDYVEHARDQLASADLPRSVARIAMHRAVVPYSVFQTCPSPHVLRAKNLNLPWRTQLCMRGWCRFLAGLITISGRRGRASTARIQDCCFCGRAVRNSTVHCLSDCTAWRSSRGAFCEAAGISRDAHSKDEFARAVLACVPGHNGFQVVAEWLDQVDMTASMGH